MTKQVICCFFIILCFLCTVSAQEGGEFRVNGSIEKEYKGYIYLSYGGILDSTLVQDQSFGFEGEISHPMAAIVKTKNGQVTDNFYLEAGEMDLTINIQYNVTEIISVEGNQTHLMLTQLQDFFEDHQSDDDFTRLLYHKIDSIVTLQPGNQFSGALLSDLFLDPIFSFEEAMGLYGKLDTLVQQPDDLAQIKISLEKLKHTRIGNTFSHFGMKDVNGNILNTDDFEGDYLLVEFWAAWCGPCRQSNPKLVKVYKSYKSKGLEIFGVSLDEKESAWQYAIQKDGLLWPQVLAEGGFQNETIQKLLIQYIPSNYLLDREGKILAINISPFELEERLNNLINP
ncbi:MAG: TlpA disulfide reductase family protein [Cyclobacterium sp.]|uniref:TlpA disulfide reductase family protein n=1 Tax=unclassified Cyclobacterium TaxID=2615055 RepID=UPI0013D4C35A|nr:TlpA disulfide reductase family protein [Cyclobacterium sp. SYSU L10401]